MQSLHDAQTSPSLQPMVQALMHSNNLLPPSFLPTTRLMHQIKWLNPHVKEEEALGIQKRKNTRMRLHLKGDPSPILLTVHQKGAAV